MARDVRAKAKSLYTEFLKNFGKIKTVRFRVMSFSEEDSQEPVWQKDIWWSPSKERVEETSAVEPATEMDLFVRNGRHYWMPGVRRGLMKSGSSAYSGKSQIYLHLHELAQLRRGQDGPWDKFTHCEIDNGSRGFSRLWNDSGDEALFDTATGTLIQEREHDISTTWTYQKIHDIYFPLTAKAVIGDLPSGTEVYSHVALNEPLSERFFVMPPLPPARERFRAWRHERKTRISRTTYESVRSLYNRFLENFARVDSARFRVQRYSVRRDGVQRLEEEARCAWLPGTERWEIYLYDNNEKLGPLVKIANEGRKCEWMGGIKVLEEPNVLRDEEKTATSVGAFVKNLDLELLHKSEPRAQIDLTNFEVDDEAGCARVFIPHLQEARFETATNLLVEQRSIMYATKFRYQQIHDVWFPVEVCEYKRGWQQTEGILFERLVVSDVVLHEPIDKRFFDLDNPPEVDAC